MIPMYKYFLKWYQCTVIKETYKDMILCFTTVLGAFDIPTPMTLSCVDSCLQEVIDQLVLVPYTSLISVGIR